MSDVSVSDGETIVEVSNPEVGRKTKALVWKYLSFKENNNGQPQPRSLDMPTCHLCMLPVGAEDTNTTNLYSH